MIFKIIGALIICAAGFIAISTLKNDEQIKAKLCDTKQLTPAQQLSQLIENDFHDLSKSGQLPNDWKSIATIEIKMNSQLAKAILGKERPRIQRIKDGKSFLELEFMDIPDDENPGIIVQASLFNIKSKNKIFEIGRTYNMNQLNKNQMPEKASK